MDNLEEEKEKEMKIKIQTSLSFRTLHINIFHYSPHTVVKFYSIYIFNSLLTFIYLFLIFDPIGSKRNGKNSNTLSLLSRSFGKTRSLFSLVVGLICA